MCMALPLLLADEIKFENELYELYYNSFLPTSNKVQPTPRQLLIKADRCQVPRSSRSEPYMYYTRPIRLRTIRFNRSMKFCKSKSKVEASPSDLPLVPYSPTNTMSSTKYFQTKHTFLMRAILLSPNGTKN